MKKIFFLLFGLIFLLMQPLAEAEAQSTAIDQMQPIVDDTVGGLAIGGASEQKLAQIVTVGLDGRLRGLFLPVGCESGLLVIEIRELDGDEPSDVVLLRRRIPAARVPTIGPVFHLFWIVGRLPFAAGDRIAVVLQNPTGSCGIFQSPEGDSYAGGEGFFDARPNPPGWIPLTGRPDLPFMTLMRLP